MIYWANKWMGRLWTFYSSIMWIWTGFSAFSTRLWYLWSTFAKKPKSLAPTNQ